MKLEDYKIIFIAVGLIGILLVASSALSEFFTLPMGQPFSEIYVLGSDHMFENYPFNVTVGPSYLTYVDVGNRMTSSNYYVVYVKLRNATDPLPDIQTGTPSSLPPLFEYRSLLQDGQSWESQLSFSFSNVSFSTSTSLVGRLTINDAAYYVNKPSTQNGNDTGFFYQLIFELWVYNTQSNLLEYNNRFADLQLNLTRNTS